MLFVLLTFATAFALLAWIDLHKAMWLLVAILPSYLLRANVFGIPTTLLELCVLAFVIIWILKQKTCPIQKTDSFLLLSITLLILIATISVFISPDTLSALGVWKAYFIEPIALFFIYKYEIANNKFGTDRIFSAFGLCALFLSSVAIIQWLTHSGIPIPWDIEGRSTSIFDYPNALGLFLGPIVVIGFGKLLLFLKSLTQKEKLFWVLTTIISFIAIILAQSEASIVSIIMVVVIMSLWNKQTRKMTIIAILIAVSLQSISPWHTTIIEKLTLQDYSGSVRLSQWSETINMLKDNWMWGAGLSGYPIVFEPYHKATHLEIFQYPHNIFLNTWVELGLLGVLALILLGGYVMSFIKQIIKSPEALLALFALLQMIIHGLVDVPYFKNDLAIFTWMLLAIVFAYVRNKKTISQKD